MRIYECKISEGDMELLSTAYYGYCAKKDIQASILQGEIKPAPDLKEQFDDEFRNAYMGYIRMQDYITNEVMPELKNRNFNWRADFTNGVMIVTWNGEGDGPELPDNKYRTIVQENPGK